MLAPSIIPLSVLLILAALPALSQEGVLDFTQVRAKERKWLPKPIDVPPGTGRLGGICGGMLAHPSWWRVSVVALDRKEYAVGDEAVFRLSIENPGKQILYFPQYPTVADLEPTESKDYAWLPYDIWLVFSTPTGRQMRVHAITLYAALPEKERSLAVLPGQKLNLVGKTRLQPAKASILD